MARATNIMSRRVSEITYEEVVILELRARGLSEDRIELMTLWLKLSPEQKKIARAKLEELLATHQAQSAA